MHRLFSTKKGIYCVALSRHYLSFYLRLPPPPSGHPGMPGPHPGTGSSEVADWWLAITWVVEDEETEAAATPAKTIESAKIWSASFIFGNPSWICLAGRWNSLQLKRVVENCR